MRRKFMIFRDADEQVFLHKRASTVNRKRQNGNVARAVLPCAQDLVILADGGSNHFFRLCGVECFQKFPKRRRRAGFHKDRPLPLIEGAYLRNGLLRFSEEFSGILHRRVSRVIQFNSIFPSDKQRHAKSILQMLHGARYRRCRNVKFFGDLAQCTEISKGCKLPQFIQVNHRVTSCISYSETFFAISIVYNI